MSDDAPPEAAPQQLPPVYDLPSEAIDRWGALPADQPIAIHITREQMDGLMLGLRRNTLAQIELGNALRAATNSDITTANEHFVSHQLWSRQSYSDFNKFIEAVMMGSAALGPADE